MKVMRTLMMIGITIGLIAPVFSQGFKVFPEYDVPRKYTPVELELRDILAQDTKTFEQAQNAWEKLLKALDDGYFISNATVKRIERLWISQNPDYQKRRDILDELLNRIYDRPDLELEFRRLKIVFLDSIKDRELFNKENKELWRLAHDSRIVIDFYDIDSTFQAGEVAYKARDMEKAEADFLKVYNYRWFQFYHQPATDYFFEMYNRAISALIRVRKAKLDIDGLKRIKLVPAVEHIYSGVLREAIAEVERSQGKKTIGDFENQ